MPRLSEGAMSDEDRKEQIEDEIGRGENLPVPASTGQLRESGGSSGSRLEAFWQAIQVLVGKLGARGLLVFLVIACLQVSGGLELKVGLTPLAQILFQAWQLSHIPQTLLGQ